MTVNTTGGNGNGNVSNHELTIVDISTIQFDENNPNKLTDKQMEGLRQSMLRYGYLTPIIIDQNNMIVDGEHRLLVDKQLGYEKIPAYQLTFENDLERRILRQVTNKLHGQHEPSLDLAELEKLIQYDEKGLESLINVGRKQLEELEKFVAHYEHGVSNDEWKEMLQKTADMSSPEAQQKMIALKILLPESDYNMVSEAFKTFGINPSKSLVSLVNEWRLLKDQ